MVHASRGKLLKSNVKVHENKQAPKNLHASSSRQSGRLKVDEHRTCRAMPSRQCRDARECESCTWNRRVLRRARWRVLPGSLFLRPVVRRLRWEPTDRFACFGNRTRSKRRIASVPIADRSHRALICLSISFMVGNQLTFLFGALMN